jgi:ribosome maturation factor RimP
MKVRLELVQHSPHRAERAFRNRGSANASMSDVVAAVRALIEPEVERLGYELVRLAHQGGESRAVLQVMAETADGIMTIEDCVRLSHALSDLLDQHEDMIPFAYRLEVSSPGIDRPLTRLKDFSRWAGFDAKFQLKAPVAGRKRLAGRLDGLEGSDVLLSLESGPQRLPFEAIESAKLVLTDALIAATTPTGHARQPDDPLDQPPVR